MENFKGEIFPELNYSIKRYDDLIDSALKELKKEDCQTVEQASKNSSIVKTGIYIFSDSDNKIQYVGISRDIRFRLKQHINYKSSSSASLAYLMAKKIKSKKWNWTKPEDWNVKRGFWSKLKKSFEQPNSDCREKTQTTIKNYKVTFVKCDDNFELALFEVYTAVKLQAYWNSFKTH